MNKSKSKFKFSGKSLKFILISYLVWQVVLILISLFSSKFILPKSGYRYSQFAHNAPEYLLNRANFDGYHYLLISQKGYGTYQQAFFPMYPRLIKIISPFLGSELLAGLIISNVCFLLSLFLFYKLICLDYREEIARKALIFLMIFPTSFFFGAVYTESLFLVLVLGSFYAARKGNWWAAGALGGLASYTRVVGILIFPALIYEWYEQNKIKSLRMKIKSLSPLFLIPLGLLSYMNYLRQNYKDPLLFIHVQSYFGANRSSGKIILLYQVFWRYLKMVLTTKADILYFTVWLELLSALGFIALLVLAFKQKMRLSYLIFSSLAFIMPTLSGTFSSLPRYILVLFPAFIYLGMIKNRIIQFWLKMIFGLLLIISAALFYQGYWIS